MLISDLPYPTQNLTIMTIKIFLTLIFLQFSALFAAPSSIDALSLPEVPANRYNLEKVELVQADSLVWYTAYSFHKSGELEIKHGLWIERTRSRDRERYNTDYEEMRRIYYEGEASIHGVKSIWVAGVLRQRDYILSENLVITIEYNDQGQEMMGPKANARGGRAKREQIIRVFNDVYKLTN